MHIVDEPEPSPTVISHEVTLEIIERIQKGDAAAWEALHQRYRDALTRLARGRLNGEIRRRLDTEDLVQSTFIAAHNGLGKFEHRGPGSFEAWISQILANRIRQKQREHLCDRRDVRRQSDGKALQGLQDPSSLSPGEALLAAEEHLRYVEALGELPEHARDILVATEIDGQSVASVAESMGLSEATIRRRRASAIAALTNKVK